MIKRMTCIAAMLMFWGMMQSGQAWAADDALLFKTSRSFKAETAKFSS
jgi:hypothetical protein